MSQTCTTTHTCTPNWYTAQNNSDTGTEEDIIAQAGGFHAIDLNIVCVTKTGTIQFQVQDDLGVWFTPTESAYTIQDSNVVRLPRANMPAIRIIATGDAVFSIYGSLE